MSSEATALVTGEAQTLARREDAGVMALAQMSEPEFEARLNLLKQGQERIRIIQRELMVVDEDYGVIPGTKKPTLLKPGAEKLASIYGLVATFTSETIEGDGEIRPHLRVKTSCFVHKGSETGPIVAQGEGAANSWERRHRYRQGQRACPQCGVEGSLLRSKKEDERGDRGWFCWAKRGGCGAQFVSSTPAIVQQDAGEIENKDPYDVENTLVKISLKRAFVDGMLRATATSGLFTQDLEDSEGSAHEDRASAEPTPHQTVSTTQPASPTPAPHQAAQAAPATPSARPSPQNGGRASLPACPRCHKTRPVMKSKKPELGQYYCFPKSSDPGCGLSFNDSDIGRSFDSADRAAGITDDDVPF